ncbi:RNA polymerase sigma-70 factor [Chitinophaga sp. Cy-1792]|uniref:RNA polymerase sigma-70 factor n=1 Tax=Chitinophaga sp. Cy-1792 TaxID=2608339 RepID=UPI00141E0C3E|nr:RNA polymerase sigma-70 factor [Chitinophaga sp. Cy-1792]NIG52952.1 RNA polymerase sigma-70 factor [Chitinophaga sp. Cy-1792]
MSAGFNTEQTLIGLKNRDKSVFTNVYQLLYPQLFVAAANLVGKEQAEEIVQDVFLSVWEKEIQLEHPAALKSYLYKAVVNRAINHLRKESSHKTHHDNITRLQDESYLCTFIEEQELQERIFYAIERLPKKCREIFKLNRYSGLKNQEIATKLGISVKTVENQMTIALRQLKEELLDKVATSPSPAARNLILLLIGI